MLESAADVRGASMVAGVIGVRSNAATPSPEVAGGGLSLRQNPRPLGVDGRSPERCRRTESGRHNAPPRRPTSAQP
eukprot:1859075-Prymnesium_polylepis.1